VHNHSVAVHLEGNSYAGRLLQEETSLLVNMSKSRVKPMDILATLKQRDPLNATTMKTIYNAGQRHKTVEKGGRSQMQLLLGQLAKHGYIESHRQIDDTETVIGIFWAHPVSWNCCMHFHMC
jgi:hypothetical protein